MAVLPQIQVEVNAFPEDREISDKIHALLRLPSFGVPWSRWATIGRLTSLPKQHHCTFFKWQEIARRVGIDKTNPIGMSKEWPEATWATKGVAKRIDFMF
jgi:hypothetical protein